MEGLAEEVDGGRGEGLEEGCGGGGVWDRMGVLGELGGVCARLGTLAEGSGLAEPSLRSMLGMLCRESRSAKRALSSLVLGEGSSLDSVGTRESGDCLASLLSIFGRGVRAGRGGELTRREVGGGDAGTQLSFPVWRSLLLLLTH